MAVRMKAKAISLFGQRSSSRTPTALDLSLIAIVMLGASRMKVAKTAERFSLGSLFADFTKMPLRGYIW